MPNSKDPYRAAGYCYHKSLQGDPGVGFSIWIGDDPPDDPPRIPFVGDVYQEISWEGFDHEGHQCALLQIVKFQMTGEHPDFGTLTISLDSTRPGVVASLRALDAGAKFPIVHTTRLHVIATASAIPGVLLQDQGPPLEFISEPSESWPPVDTVYRLGVPVKFEDRENPGTVLVSAGEGAVMVNSLRQ
jgi:hypothetical protein